MAAILGVGATKVTGATAISEFRLGTVMAIDHPTLGYQEFIYMRANGAITGLGYMAVEQTGFDMAQMTDTLTAPGSSGPGSRCGAAQAAMADNEYGWFQIYGKGSVRTLASAAKGTRLNSTATTGALDDDGTAGLEQIMGVVIGTATGGAAATNADAYFTYPVVGQTL
jgi:hypothetical protein